MHRRIAGVVLAVALAVGLPACTDAATPPAGPPPTDVPAAEIPAGMSRDEAVRRGLIAGDHLAIIDHRFSRGGAHHLQVQNLGRLDGTFELALEPADAGTVEPAAVDLPAEGGRATVVVEAPGPVELVVRSRGTDGGAAEELARLALPPPDA